MLAMPVGKAVLTADDLFRLPHGEKRYELLDGELMELPLNGARHGAAVATVCFELHSFAAQRRLGVVLLGETGVILRRNPDRVRAPDVCFIAAERLPGGQARRVLN
jgi:Uma2 family endonuclease